MPQYNYQSIHRFFGLDRAVAYTIAARLLQIVGSVGTVLLILRFMSAVEQGYYYTLLSLTALQMIFELGFSFVILQLATHEAALVTIGPDGFVCGDQDAYSRLASVLQLTVRWYRRCAVMFAVFLLPLGVVFFHHRGGEQNPVSWFGPWVSAVVALSLVLFVTPLFSFLEGCGQVQQVAKIRMFQALAVFICSWVAIASGHGLYACALVNAGFIGVGLVFIARNSPLFRALWTFQADSGTVSWRKEIWPFQWKIALTWLCSYFTMQIFTPILFACKGATAAGRMGLSISIATCLQSVAMAWITPKAAPFGRLVKLGQLKELRDVFLRTFWQSLGALCGLVVICMTAIMAAQTLWPRIALRMESPAVMSLLFVGAISGLVVQAMAVYLRSFKREPYLIQAISVSAVMLGLVLWLTPFWSSAAIAVTYCVVNTGLGLPWGIAIFYFHHKTAMGASIHIEAHTPSEIPLLATRSHGGAGLENSTQTPKVFSI